MAGAGDRGRVLQGARRVAVRARCGKGHADPNGSASPARGACTSRTARRPNSACGTVRCRAGSPRAFRKAESRTESWRCRLAILLGREGRGMNLKKVYRLYREERPTVRKRCGRERAFGTRAPMAITQEPSQRRWLDEWDYIPWPSRSRTASSNRSMVARAMSAEGAPVPLAGCGEADRRSMANDYTTVRTAASRHGTRRVYLSSSPKA